VATIRQRGGRWQAMVRKRGHPPVAQTFDTKTAARTWATRTEAMIDAGRKVNIDRAARFADVLTAYRGLFQNGRPVSRSKAQALDAIGAGIGSWRMADFAPAALVRYAKSRHAAGAGATTVGMDLTYIGTVLRHGAPLIGLDSSHALEAVRTARGVLSHSGGIARSRERTRRPTDDELRAIRDYWHVHPTREIPMWNLVQFAIATAMRLGEIVRLEWAGLDSRARTILIRDRKHPRRKQGNDQRVPLLVGHAEVDGEAIDPLALINARPKGAAQIFPYVPASVSTAFTRAAKACGIQDLHFHDLRHHGVSLLFEAGYAIEEVALVSGHADWNMLRRYTQLRAERFRARPLA
jgi:integrase